METSQRKEPATGQEDFQVLPRNANGVGTHKKTEKKSHTELGYQSAISWSHTSFNRIPNDLF